MSANVRMEAAVRSSQGSPAALTGAGGMLLMLLIASAGAVVDVTTGPGLRRIFAISLVAGAGLATLLVRRAGLWLAVISPPLVYVTVSAVTTFASDERVATVGDLANFVVTWLVYGFPEMAAATGLTLVIAGIRLTRT